MEVHVSVSAEELFSIGPFSVTNSFLTTILVMTVVLLAGIVIGRRVKLIPSRTQAAAEVLIEALLGITEGAGGRSFGRRVFPLVSGLFIFILFANYSGLLPGVGTVGVYKTEEHSEETVDGEEAEGTTEEAGVYTVAAVGGVASPSRSAAAESEDGKTLVPFLRPPTADLNTTLALALVSFTAIQIYGIQANGVRGRIKHMADPVFLFPIEVISELSRIISLSARLFGNVFAGEVLLTVMYTIASKIAFVLIPLVVPVIFLFLELMFGTIQALVFALLTLTYIAVAAAHHDEDEHHGAGHPDPGPPVPAKGSVGD